MTTNGNHLALRVETYIPVTGSRFSRADAARIGPVLYRLALEGKTTAPHIVEEATDPDSPLHEDFEWSDTEAARKYRENQARDMARSIAIRIITEGAQGFPKVTTTRFFFAVHNPEAPQLDSGRQLRHYTPANVVVKQMDMRAQIVETGTQQLLGWMARYKQYRELFEENNNMWQGIFQCVEDMMDGR